MPLIWKQLNSPETKITPPTRDLNASRISISKLRPSVHRARSSSVALGLWLFVNCNWPRAMLMILGFRKILVFVISGGFQGNTWCIISQECFVAFFLRTSILKFQQKYLQQEESFWDENFSLNFPVNQLWSDWAGFCDFAACGWI